MAPVASALKGATLLRTELELPSRMLQDTQVPPPMLPKGTQAPNVGVDGTTKKADKETKTKEKKCVKGPKDDVPPPPALPPASAPSMPLPNDEEPFCVQGAATLEECQSAQDGKTPQEDQSIFGDVQVDISYDSTPGNNGTTITATDVLNKVEAIFQTDTTFDFLGCEAYDSVSSFPGNDGWGRRSLQTTGSEMPHTLGHNASTIEEIRVTGVDFTKVQASENGKC